MVNFSLSHYYRTIQQSFYHFNEVLHLEKALLYGLRNKAFNKNQEPVKEGLNLLQLFSFLVNVLLFVIF
jgi:hypothetical protein